VQFAADNDTVLGDWVFLSDLGRDIPTSLLQGGRYELCADIAFGKLFFIHQANFPCSFMRSQKATNCLLASLKGTVLLFSQRLIVEKLTPSSWAVLPD
jgi:hypothetical protein